MQNVGNAQAAREHYLEHRPSNLHFLLKKRYEWMNAFIRPEDEAIEFGSGPGFSAQFIQSKNFKMTDVEKYPWVQARVDALNSGYPDESFDVVVACNMIHHLASPVTFIQEIYRLLRPGGRMVIQDVHTSFMMKVMMLLMKHEGWSYQIQVFDPSLVANDPKDPWSANCAIPELLFEDHQKFEENFPGFSVIHDRFCEAFIFPLSGGVIAKKKLFPNLPYGMLRLIDRFDDLLTRAFPDTFALGRQVVLKKGSV